MSYHHVSVMSDEAIAGLAVKSDGTYLDCTLGGAGHASLIAGRLSKRGRVIGLDRDIEAVVAGRDRLSSFDCRTDVVHENFKHLGDILERLGEPLVDGILFDLGVSSHQIDSLERGFSYMHDAPLDMRMDTESQILAYDVINGRDEGELADIFFRYGEERWSRRIAHFIVERRRIKPIETTGELADTICMAVPKRWRHSSGGHPAKRVFQAIRIEVNDELGILESAIYDAVHHLKPGGRLVVITFHSLEDRIVKDTLRQMSKGCVCPPGLPVCVCGHEPEIRLVGKATKPGADEVNKNPRSKSAKLRVAERAERGVGDAGRSGEGS